MAQNISQPKSTISIVATTPAATNQPQKILVVSQKVAAGTAVSGALNENIQDDANALAGINSIAAEVVRGVRAVNTETQVDDLFG